MQPDPSVRKVLIYRMGSLGDTVVALPCFHLIARTFPRSERAMLTNFPANPKAPSSAAVLGDSGLVNRYLRYTVGTRNPLELLRLAWQVRRFRPDVMIYLSDIRPYKNLYRDLFFFRWACGVKRIFGVPPKEELRQSYYLSTGVYNFEHHFDNATGMYESEAPRLARWLADLGDAHPEDLANWDLRLTDAERELPGLGSLKEQPLIVCGPGTKMQAKDWGQEKWRALLVRISPQYSKHALVMVGAREDAEVADYAAQEWRGSKANLCGQLTPRETAAVLEHADLFLGPDSGPMHLAASLGVPCVIAFSARGLPGTWFPVGQQHQIIYHRTSCAGCRLNTCTAEGRRCLTSITVEEMAEAVAKVLGPGCRNVPLVEGFSTTRPIEKGRGK